MFFFYGFSFNELITLQKIKAQEQHTCVSLFTCSFV